MKRWFALPAVLICATTALSAAALERNVVERGVHEKQGELLECYEGAVTRNPDLSSGKLVMRYRVEKDGKVSRADIVRNDLRDPKLGECVRQVFLSLDYGAQERPSNVTYPLDFD